MPRSCSFDAMIPETCRNAAILPNASWFAKPDIYGSLLIVLCPVWHYTVI